MTSFNVAEAKRHLSELLGRVAYGGETILITRRGKPMAKLIPPDAGDESAHLGNVQGWLDDDDAFFAAIDEIVEDRFDHKPRVLADSPAGRKAPQE